MKYTIADVNCSGMCQGLYGVIREIDTRKRRMYGNLSFLTKCNEYGEFKGQIDNIRDMKVLNMQNINDLVTLSREQYRLKYQSLINYYPNLD